jgi:hypothetical protein
MCWNCSRNQGRGMGESNGVGNSSMIYLIYCKNLCKCYNVPPPSTIKKFYIHSCIESILTIFAFLTFFFDPPWEVTFKVYNKSSEKRHP